MEVDPTSLRNESRRRKTKPDKAADVPEWTAERFADAFVGVEPKPTVVLTTEAKKAGLSERRVSTLLKQAEATGLAHRWQFAPNKPIQYSTQGQLAT